MIDKEQIIANLREVFDPEISFNVYDLGLIYSVDVNETDAAHEVTITHTLTSAFCPFADQIVDDIKQAGYVPEVKNVIVNTVFDPPFTIEMVPDEIRMAMGE